MNINAFVNQYGVILDSKKVYHDVITKKYLEHISLLFVDLNNKLKFEFVFKSYGLLKKIIIENNKIRFKRTGKNKLDEILSEFNIDINKNYGLFIIINRGYNIEFNVIEKEYYVKKPEKMYILNQQEFICHNIMNDLKKVDIIYKFILELTSTNKFNIDNLSMIGFENNNITIDEEIKGVLTG